MFFYIFVRFAGGRGQLPRRFVLIYRKKSAPGRYAWPPRIHLPNLARDACEARDAPEVCEDPAVPVDADELKMTMLTKNRKNGISVNKITEKNCRRNECAAEC